MGMIGSLICRTFLGDMESVVVDADRWAFKDGGGCGRVDADDEDTLEEAEVGAEDVIVIFDTGEGASMIGSVLAALLGESLTDWTE